jgi:CcmD family protein
MTYLLAAYVITWLIHASYLGILARRYSRLRKEIDELRKP